MGRQANEATSQTSPGLQPLAQLTGPQVPARQTLPDGQESSAQGSVFITQTPPGAQTSPLGQSGSLVQVQRPPMQPSEVPRRSEQRLPHSPQLSGSLRNPAPEAGTQAAQSPSTPQGRSQLATAQAWRSPEKHAPSGITSLRHSPPRQTLSGKQSVLTSQAKRVWPTVSAQMHPLEAAIAAATKASFSTRMS